MIREVMERADLTIWPMITLVIFTVVTILMLLWIFRKGSASLYKEMSVMALDESEKAEITKHE
jgi:hypothetical protein